MKTQEIETETAQASKQAATGGHTLGLIWIAKRFLQIRRNSGNGDKGSVRKWTKAETERSFVDLESIARAAIAKAEGRGL